MKSSKNWLNKTRMNTDLQDKELYYHPFPLLIRDTPVPFSEATGRAGKAENSEK